LDVVPILPDRPSGLRSAEAEQRLARYGPNEPVSVRRLCAPVQPVGLFANPLVIFLLVAGAISASLGQRTDALIIMTIVLLGIAIKLLANVSLTAGRRSPASVGCADRHGVA
jgi:Mg2+-importing ATPase